MNVWDEVDIHLSRSDFIHSSFKGAGFLVEEKRPLKVRFTLIHVALSLSPLEALPSPLRCFKFHLILFWTSLDVPFRQLHCTIINTVYRKPKPPDGKRAPFAYPDLLTSSWFSRSSTTSIPPSYKAVPQKSSARSASDTDPSICRPVSVDFGTWAIDEVQVCEMGSYGPEGEYVCVGKISL